MAKSETISKGNQVHTASYENGENPFLYCILAQYAAAFTTEFSREGLYPIQAELRQADLELPRDPLRKALQAV